MKHAKILSTDCISKNCIFVGEPLIYTTMHQAVETYLANEREKVLISLGLIDHYVKEYGPYGAPYVMFDKDTQQYYYNRPVAVDVTDAEFEKILQLATLRQQTAKVPTGQTANNKIESRHRLQNINNGAEKTLRVFNMVFLILGIILASLTLISGLMAPYSIARQYRIIIAIGIVLVFLYNWAIMKTFINISNNLHEINAKIE